MRLLLSGTGWWPGPLRPGAGAVEAGPPGASPRPPSTCLYLLLVIFLALTMITPLSVLQPRIPRELGFPAARLEVPISSGGFVRGAAGRASAVRQEGWGPDSILSSRLAEAVLHIPGVSAVGLLGGLAGGRVSGQSLGERAPRGHRREQRR